MIQQEENQRPMDTLDAAPAHLRPVTVRLAGVPLSGRTVVLEGCSSAMRVKEVLQHACMAIGLPAGAKLVCGAPKLRGDETLTEVRWRAGGEDVLEAAVLEAGGAGGEEGELGMPLCIAVPYQMLGKLLTFHAPFQLELTLRIASHQ